MNSKIIYYSNITSLLFLILFASCKKISTQPGVDDSLEPVEEVSLISGASNTTITVNKSEESYFAINFSSIESNSIINDGEKEGWCIDWQKPINSSGGTYENIKLYSTYNVEKWKPINYLFNILDELYNTIPELTHREIQLAVWSMRGNPEFDITTIDPDNASLDMFHNGEPLFNVNILEEILEVVEAGYKTFEPGENSRFAVIAETPVDVQTVITVIEN